MTELKELPGPVCGYKDYIITVLVSLYATGRDDGPAAQLLHVSIDRSTIIKKKKPRTARSAVDPVGACLPTSVRSPASTLVSHQKQ
jgi:hypothetical protein